MMRTLGLGALVVGSVFLLSGCGGDQEGAETILLKGCEAAAKHLTSSSFQVEAVKDPVFSEVSYGEDEDLRQIEIAVTETKGRMSRQKSYRCVFAEETPGFFGGDYKADLYRVEVGNLKLGKGGSTTDNDPARWEALVTAVNSAL